MMLTWSLGATDPFSEIFALNNNLSVYSSVIAFLDDLMSKAVNLDFSGRIAGQVSLGSIISLERMAHGLLKNGSIESSLSRRLPCRSSLVMLLCRR